MEISTSQVPWASTSQIPAVEMSEKKSGNKAEVHLPHSIAIKNIPVVLHPVSSEDPLQYLDMKLGSGTTGTIRTFCKNRSLQFKTGTVTLGLHLRSVSKKSEDVEEIQVETPSRGKSTKNNRKGQTRNGKASKRGCIFRISLVSKDTKESASQMGFGQVWRGKLSKNGQLHSGH